MCRTRVHHAPGRPDAVDSNEAKTTKKEKQAKQHILICIVFHYFLYRETHMGNTGRAPHSHIPLNEPCVQTCRVQAAKRRDSLSPDGTTEVAAQVKCGTMDRCVIAMQLKTATPDLPGQTASQPRPKGFSTGKPPKLRLSLTRSSIFEPSSSFPPQNKLKDTPLVAANRSVFIYFL